MVQSALEGFAAAQPTAAIVTKLDEAPYTAGVLSALTTGGGFPISYITNGQQVPEDIAVATTDHLVARLLPDSRSKFNNSKRPNVFNSISTIEHEPILEKPDADFS